MVCQVGDVLQDVTRQHDGGPRLGCAMQGGEHELTLSGVQTGARLVEQQHVRLGCQCLCQPDPSLHTTRQGLATSVRHLLQIDQCQRLTSLLTSA